MQVKYKAAQLLKTSVFHEVDDLVLLELQIEPVCQSLPALDAVRTNGLEDRGIFFVFLNFV